ncbi:MAG: type II secretion system F family protein [Acidimicrobiia bacterium]|nr:type II secretion system F family protein [Acidimicrobiia bacterium]MCY4432744.1 type II secretion system F family protein [bacterium]
MTVGLVLGSLLGLGLATIFWGLFPPRESLQIRLSELDQPLEDGHRSGTPRERIGRAAAQSFGPLGLRGRRVEQDLRAAGQSLEELAVAKLAMLLLGAGLPVGVWIVAWFGGAWVSPILVVVASILAGGLFFLVPDLSLREKARRRRRELRHQISTYLDLVGLHLSGGSGMERALADSAGCGLAWGFVEIQRTLRQAQLANEPSWTALEKLGHDLGSTEMEELAAWLLLAGTSGSHVRSSLHTKARGLRERALNEAETEAQQATERMSLPVVLMFTGFLGLIGYPAIAAIVSA